MEAGVEPGGARQLGGPSSVIQKDKSGARMRVVPGAQAQVGDWAGRLRQRLVAPGDVADLGPRRWRDIAAPKECARPRSGWGSYLDAMMRA